MSAGVIQGRVGWVERPQVSRAEGRMDFLNVAHSSSGSELSDELGLGSVGRREAMAEANFLEISGKRRRDESMRGLRDVFGYVLSLSLILETTSSWSDSTKRLADR